MKENSDGNDTNVGSIEEDIRTIIEKIEYIKYELPYSEYLHLENAFEHILSDYKRVLKENEELNNRCRNLDKEAQAYLEELAGDNTLTRRTIKQLQKENKELKNDYENLSNSVVVKNYYIENSIPVQKVKDKIEEEKLPLVIVGGRRNKRTLEYGIKLGRRQALQELLEGRE